MSLPGTLASQSCSAHWDTCVFGGAAPAHGNVNVTAAPFGAVFRSCIAGESAIPYSFYIIDLNGSAYVSYEAVGGGTLTDEESVVSKTRDLMTAIDMARRYRTRSASLVDFAIALLAIAVVCTALYICFTCLLYAYGFGPGVNSTVTLGVLAVAAGGVVAGMAVSEMKVKGVRGGAWQADLDEGFPGALKTLTNLDWAAAIGDVRVARAGRIVDGFMRIVAYTLLLSVLLGSAVVAADVPAIHQLILRPYWFVPAVALVLVVAASWGGEGEFSGLFGPRFARVGASGVQHWPREIGVQGLTCM